MTAERFLIWYLRISALGFLAAAPAVFMPTTWMQSIGASLGLDVPDVALMQYLTRSVSALYTGVGVIYWYLSCDLKRYLPFLRFTLPLTIVFGVIVTALDVWIPMPTPWIVGESGTILVWTAGLWWLLRAVESGPHSDVTYPQAEP